MSLFSLGVLKLGVFFVFSLFLACTIILISFTFSLSAPDAEKLSAYECGFDPYEDARNVFDVRFYLVAIFFIIFDLEAIFFFPWVISLSSLEPNSIFFFWDFIIELMIGLAYCWQIRALE